MGRAGRESRGREALRWEQGPHSEQAPCWGAQGERRLQGTAQGLEHQPGLAGPAAPDRQLRHGPREQPPCAPSTHPSHWHSYPQGFCEEMGHRGRNTAPGPSAGQRNTPKQPNPPHLWVRASYDLLRLLFMPTTSCREARGGTTTTLAKES